MESDFFARQAQARRQTAWLRLAFALAVLLVSLAVPVAAIGSLGMRPLRMLRDHPQVALWCAIPVFLYIAGASWWRWRKLRAGGSVVALALGGRLLSEQERDPARKRLVNIVEEMAIAAGIERPQVYLLEQSPASMPSPPGTAPRRRS
ncbi:MAG: hypothetical protein U1F11_11155 [Steroidobacteraceae bacterium]